MQKFYVHSKFSRDEIEIVLGEKETPTLFRIGNQKRQRAMESSNSKVFESFQEAKEYGIKFLQDRINELQLTLLQRKNELDRLKDFEELDCKETDFIW